jgi:hypothetical protein
VLVPDLGDGGCRGSPERTLLAVGMSHQRLWRVWPDMARSLRAVCRLRPRLRTPGCRRRAAPGRRPHARWLQAWPRVIGRPIPDGQAARHNHRQRQDSPASLDPKASAVDGHDGAHGGHHRHVPCLSSLDYEPHTEGTVVALRCPAGVTAHLRGSIRR